MSKTQVLEKDPFFVDFFAIKDSVLRHAPRVHEEGKWPKVVNASERFLRKIPKACELGEGFDPSVACALGDFVPPAFRPFLASFEVRTEEGMVDEVRRDFPGIIEGRRDAATTHLMAAYALQLPGGVGIGEFLNQCASFRNQTRNKKYLFNAARQQIRALGNGIYFKNINGVAFVEPVMGRRGMVMAYFAGHEIIVLPEGKNTFFIKTYRSTGLGLDPMEWKEAGVWLNKKTAKAESWEALGKILSLAQEHLK